MNDEKCDPDEIVASIFREMARNEKVFVPSVHANFSYFNHIKSVSGIDSRKIIYQKRFPPKET